MEKLAQFWKAWSEDDGRIEQADTWADVMSNIVVKEVAALVPDDSWERYRCDLVAKRAVPSVPSTVASQEEEEGEEGQERR